MITLSLLKCSLSLSNLLSFATAVTNWSAVTSVVVYINSLVDCSDQVGGLQLLAWLSAVEKRFAVISIVVFSCKEVCSYQHSGLQLLV